MLTRADGATGHSADRRRCGASISQCLAVFARTKPAILPEPKNRRARNQARPALILWATEQIEVST